MKIALIALALLLIGCSAQQPHSMTDHHAVESEQQFLAMMIPHHQEAVDSSRLMLDSQNPQVRDLAQRIITAQKEEILIMEQWLATWYDTPRPEAHYEAMMPNLTQFEGAARDEAYLQGMIGHHEGAVHMAQEVLALQPRPEVAELAHTIIRVQEAEIAEMQDHAAHVHE